MQAVVFYRRRKTVRSRGKQCLANDKRVSRQSKQTHSPHLSAAFESFLSGPKTRLQTKLQLQSSTREPLSVGKWQNGLRGRSAGFMEIQSPAAVSRQPNANSSPISLLFLLRCCLMKIQFHWKLLKEKLIFTLKLAHRWRCLPLTSLYLL